MLRVSDWLFFPSWSSNKTAGKVTIAYLSTLPIVATLNLTISQQKVGVIRVKFEWKTGLREKSKFVGKLAFDTTGFTREIELKISSVLGNFQRPILESTTWTTIKDACQPHPLTFLISTTALKNYCKHLFTSKNYELDLTYQNNFLFSLFTLSAR